MAGRPSSVVIALPETAATGVTQERISLPSNSTEHAPHCARPHPNLGPCRWSSLCRTYRSGVSRLAVTLCTRPFTLIFNLLAIPTLRFERTNRRQEGSARNTSPRSRLYATLRLECKAPSIGQGAANRTTEPCGPAPSLGK